MEQGLVEAATETRIEKVQQQKMQVSNRKENGKENCMGNGNVGRSLLKILHREKTQT